MREHENVFPGQAPLFDEFKDSDWNPVSSVEMDGFIYFVSGDTVCFMDAWNEIA